MVIKTNCQSVLSERKLKETKLEGKKKDYMFFYIHLHTYVLYTRALLMYLKNIGLPIWLSGKESIFQCRRHGFNPCVQEDPLEEKMTAPSSILTWEMPWTEEPGGL